MTCHEFELAVAREESGALIEEHRHACAACRKLAEEMRANSEALLAFSDEDLPGVRNAVMAEIRGRKRMRWDWALAAAAMLLVTFGLSRMLRVDPVPPPEVRVAVSAPKIEIPPVQAVKQPAVKQVVKRRTSEPAPALMVKMLTSDPDVVIYWSIEAGEGDK